MSMSRFADHVIAVAREVEVPVTNLKLHKVMYFVLKEAKKLKLLNKRNIEQIYDEPFEVWQYGPVLRSQYYRFKIFASAPIICDFEKDKKFEILDDLIKKYLKKNVFHLVQESQKNDYWIENKEFIDGYTSTIVPKIVPKCTPFSLYFE